MGTWPVHRAPCGEELLVLVQCSAVTALKFLIISDQVALCFNFVLGPVNGVAGPAPLGATGLMGRHKSDGRGPASPLGGPQIGERGMATPRTQTTQGAGMAFTTVSPQAEVGDTILALRGLRSPA